MVVQLQGRCLWGGTYRSKQESIVVTVLSSNVKTSKKITNRLTDDDDDVSAYVGSHHAVEKDHSLLSSLHI